MNKITRWTFREESINEFITGSKLLQTRPKELRLPRFYVTVSSITIRAGNFDLMDITHCLYALLFRNDWQTNFRGIEFNNKNS